MYKGTKAAFWGCGRGRVKEGKNITYKGLSMSNVTRGHLCHAHSRA